MAEFLILVRFYSGIKISSMFVPQGTPSYIKYTNIVGLSEKAMSVRQFIVVRKKNLTDSK